MKTSWFRIGKSAILSIVLFAGLLQAIAQSFSVDQVQRSDDRVTLEWSEVGADFGYTIQSRSTVGGIWLYADPAESWPVVTTHWTGSWSGQDRSRFYRILAVPAAERGMVLSHSLAASHGSGFIQLLLNFQGIAVVAQHDVTVYRIDYETVDPWGGRTTASGVLAVPAGSEKPRPLFCYQHGTITRPNAAPSSLDLTGEYALGIIAATTGYAAVLPDYLGMGTSPGFHPYHHAKSEATAGVDLLRAARSVAAIEGIALNGQLFLCGYSQGGHAAMALHRELETFHADEFTVTASAPMSGAYDLSGVTADDFLSDRPKPEPYYFAYLLAAYQEVYRLAPSFEDLLVAPYDIDLPALLNGNTEGSDINDAMPKPPEQPIDILKPEYLAAFVSDPDHPLRQALQANDVYEWTPHAPVRLYRCSGDLDVPPINSEVAFAEFVRRGASNVELIDPAPGSGHADCSMPSLLQAKAWFDSMKD